MKTLDTYVEVHIPKGEKYLNIARLAAAGIASNMDFALDEIEDIKLALTEACAKSLSCIKQGGNKLEINFRSDHEKLEITIEDKDQNIETKEFEKENNMEISFIRSLMDELEYAASKDFGTKMKMVKYNEKFLSKISNKRS